MMARGNQRRHAFTILLLCLPVVLSSPFPVPVQQEQVTLQGGTGYDHGRDDPLKNFVSDVAHDTTSSSSDSSSRTTTVVIGDGTATVTTSSLSVPVPASSSSSSSSLPSPSSLRYATQVGGEHDLTSRPSWFTSTLLARRLLAKSPVGIASTVYQKASSSSSAPPGLQGVPIGLPEYIADCSEQIDDDDSSKNNDSGNPILLGLNVASTFQNTAHGSNISLSIDWWDHVNHIKPLYPDFPLSEAGLPRVSLLGYVEHIDLSSASQQQNENLRSSLEECFLASHPDARAWLPGNPDSPHTSFWARIVVTQAYWIGGFGDLQQIGWINMTEWRGIGRFESASDIGDGSGRGWEDVTLPGE